MTHVLHICLSELWHTMWMCECICAFGGQRGTKTFIWFSNDSALYRGKLSLRVSHTGRQIALHCLFHNVLIWEIAVKMLLKNLEVYIWISFPALTINTLSPLCSQRGQQRKHFGWYLGWVCHSVARSWDAWGLSQSFTEEHHWLCWLKVAVYLALDSIRLL